MLPCISSVVSSVGVIPTLRTFSSKEVLGKHDKRGKKVWGKCSGVNLSLGCSTGLKCTHEDWKHVVMFIKKMYRLDSVLTVFAPEAMCFAWSLGHVQHGHRAPPQELARPSPTRGPLDAAV